MSDAYDPKFARRIGELSSVAAALKEWDAAESSIHELKGMLASKDVELRQMATDELQSTNASLHSLSRRLSATLTPKDPFAEMPCLIEILPGPGGTEGRYFADALFRMYKAYCSRKGYRAQVVKYELADGDSTSSAGESAIMEAVLEVQNPGAYGTFRGEAGMHRVQRVPSTEKNGRTHTSAVAVWVLPSFPENSKEGEEQFNDPQSDFYINPQEVKSEVMRAGGAGGQHVNKTESAVRLTHIPTGTVVSMQDSRSQHRNREDAWRLLRSRVALIRREERETKARSLRDSVLSKDKITRADKIRTYNYGQDRCTDHRSGLDVHNLPNVLEGGDVLDRVVESVQEWLVSREIEAMIAEEEAPATDTKKTKR
jgi:peptide chain release factor 1